jgi:hypothetical protein
MMLSSLLKNLPVSNHYRSGSYRYPNEDPLKGDSFPN